MAEDDPIKALRARFREDERAVPTSGLARLWKTGRSAASMGTAVLGGRLRGRRGGLEAADVNDIVRLVAQLGELKGVAMKAGQILGYIDVSLPDELRGLLSVLQTASPASPFETIEATISAAFGDRAGALLAGLDRTPIAVASIGQVHRGRLEDGTEIAVKVRHPGIDDALRSDFRAAGAGSAFARLIMPGAGATVKGAIEEARSALLDECDFALEAERQVTFASLFAADATVVIPAVLPEWCAPTVLTSAWTPGRSLDAFLAGDPPQPLRDRLGVALFDFYIGTLYRHGIFHADPHPGNYAVRDDDRLVVYDFGCVRTFERATVVTLARLASAVRDDDLAAISAAMGALGTNLPPDGASLEHTRALLRGFFAPLLLEGPRRVDPGAGFETRQILSDKRALMKLSLPGELLFLFRLRFGLYAVLARLGAVADWSALERDLAREAQRT